MINTLIVNVTAGKNNTHVCVYALDGKLFYKATCGNVGFKKGRRGSFFAGESVGNSVGKFLSKNFDDVGVKIYLTGVGEGRLAVVKSLLTVSGFRLLSVADLSHLPHNGCRPRKRRRL